MSIEKMNYNHYDLFCNECGELIEGGFESFDDVVRWKKNNKHLCKSVKSPSGEWSDHCDECMDKLKN